MAGGVPAKMRMERIGKVFLTQAGEVRATLLDSRFFPAPSMIVGEFVQRRCTLVSS